MVAVITVAIMAAVTMAAVTMVATIITADVAVVVAAVVTMAAIMAVAAVAAAAAANPDTNFSRLEYCTQKPRARAWGFSHLVFRASDKRKPPQPRPWGLIL